MQDLVRPVRKGEKRRATRIVTRGLGKIEHVPKDRGCFGKSASVYTTNLVSDGDPDVAVVKPLVLDPLLLHGRILHDLRGDVDCGSDGGKDYGMQSMRDQAKVGMRI